MNQIASMDGVVDTIPDSSGGAADRRGVRGDFEPSLPSYLSEMGQIPLLDRDREHALAEELDSRRSELLASMSSLPKTLRTVVFDGEPVPVDARSIDLRQFDAACSRLLQHRSSNERVNTLIGRIRKLKSKMDRAREELVVSNLRLVVHLAKKYPRDRLTFLHLIQEGNLGLMHSVGKFDHRLGNRFSTYAYWWIKQSIDRALADKGRTIRVPVHVDQSLKKIRRTAGVLSQTMSRAPTSTEIADRLRLPVKQVADLMSVGAEPQSLEEFRERHLGRDPKEITETRASALPDKSLEVSEAFVTISRTLQKRLNEREARILRLRFGLEGETSHSLEQIGAIVGLSRERVRQLEHRAIGKLRESDVLQDLMASLGSS